MRPILLVALLAAPLLFVPAPAATALSCDYATPDACALACGDEALACAQQTGGRATMDACALLFGRDACG